MKSGSNHFYRSTLFVVLALLVIVTQLPDSWWHRRVTAPDFEDGCIAAGCLSDATYAGEADAGCELTDVPLEASKSIVDKRRNHSLASEQPEVVETYRIQPATTFRLAAWPARERRSHETTQQAGMPTVSSNQETSLVARKRTVAKTSNTSDASNTLEPHTIESIVPHSVGGSLQKERQQDSERKSTQEDRISPLDVPDLDIASPANDLNSTTADDLQSEPAWEYPRALVEQLNELREFHCNSDVSEWIEQCVNKISELHQIAEITDPEAGRIIDGLFELSQSPSAQEPRTGSLADDAAIRRAAYSIERRCAIWKQVQKVELSRQNGVEQNRMPTEVAGKIETAVAGVMALLQSADAESSGWIEFLRLRELRTAATATAAEDNEARRELARDVLRRIQSVGFTPDQKAFLSLSACQSLKTALRPWAAMPFEPRRFLLIMESFESDPNVVTAGGIVDQLENLKWHEPKPYHDLANSIETHYRNANVRLSVSGTLLNLLLPVLKPMTEPVSENVLGARVSGKNETWTKLEVELVPDNDRVNLTLKATGTTESKTVSRKGPVRLFSRGQSWFRAGKPIVLNRLGFGTASTRVDTNARSNLIGVETDYDRVPILGWLVRQFAIGEHRENRSYLRNHVSQRVSNTTRTRMNEVVQQRVRKSQEFFKERVLSPLHQLDIEMTAIDLKTTADRVTMRARLAGPRQLAAFTARPRALKGSVFSTQIHQSAINNVIQQMDLSGQRIELEELINRLQDRLGVSRSDIHDEIPEGVQIRLADGLPLVVQFDDNYVVIEIRIAELITDRRAYRNFVVRARYTADADNLNLNLTREGGIELVSEQIGFRDKLALRGIFTKVMANDHRLKVLRGRFEEDPRLSSLEVTQFVAQDGWIGISVGNKSAAPELVRHANTELRPTTK